jgi:hypothetical protein
VIARCLRLFRVDLLIPKTEREVSLELGTPFVGGYVIIWKR